MRIFLITLSLALAAHTAAAGSFERVPTPRNAAEGAAQKAECKESVAGYIRLEHLHSVREEKGRAPSVRVGPYFHKFDLDDRAQVMELVNCALRTYPQQCVDFEVVHWKTGALVGTWKDCNYRGPR